MSGIRNWRISMLTISPISNINYSQRNTRPQRTINFGSSPQIQKAIARTTADELAKFIQIGKACVAEIIKPASRSIYSTVIEGYPTDIRKLYETTSKEGIAVVKYSDNEKLRFHCSEEHGIITITRGLTGNIDDTVTHYLTMNGRNELAKEVLLKD